MTEPPGRILVIGEALIDVVRRADGSVAEHPGGSPANVALGLSRLGHPVLFATQIGADEHGRMIRERLGASGVELTGASTTEGPTSTAIATLDATGAAHYEFDITWDRFDGPPEAGISHLHSGSIAATLQPGAASVLEQFAAQRDGATISYDPNARPSLMGDPSEAVMVVERLIRLSDVVKASDEDLDWLYPGVAISEVVQRWTADLGARFVLVTKGGSGAVVQVGPDPTTLVTVQAPPVDVVDTVGAGDSFMAGLVSGLLDDGLLGGPDARSRLRAATADDVTAAVRRALACAAITVSRAGADPPRRDELPG